MSSNIHVFTHNDLDGIGCLLSIIWAFPESNITYTCIHNVNSFKEQFDKATTHKDICYYDKVFVTDLSINLKDLSLIDKKNVIFIDHHKTSVNLKFTAAKSFISTYTSCTLYIYKLFKSQLTLNNAQKQLLVYIDDYDSFKLKFSLSTQLNSLFWSHYQHNTILFIEDFMDGFIPFTSLQQKAINIYNNKIKDVIKDLKVFKAATQIQGKYTSIIAAFANTAINDITVYLQDKYISDIILIINLKNNRVSFRHNKNSSIDVALLAQNLCEGGGHESAAGGEITDRFLTFSKLFTPL